MGIRRRIFLTLFALFLLFAEYSAASGEPVCPGESLKFGMSTALTGPAARLGINMRDGVLAFFAEANAAGGIGGRELCLVTLDDGYEPERTVPNMHVLIEKEKVLGVIGNVGTPTAVVAIPIATRNKTLFLGAYTGAGVLRKIPPDRYIMNYRASYAEETAAMVDALISKGGFLPEEIAFFTQRDTFGDAGFAGGLDALKNHGLRDERLISHGRYERNTDAVENGLADILMARTSPKAVIMVGAYSSCATFIRLARQSGLKGLFLNVSFVGAEPLAADLGSDGEGVIITQVVPHYESNVPVVREFRGAFSVWRPELSPSFGALEGYIVATILHHALQKSTSPVSRESIVAALEGLDEFDIGLEEWLLLNRTEHQASHRVWPTIIKNGKVVPFDWKELTQGR